jgi:solute carrier family 50 protein (sugar transporter)
MLYGYVTSDIFPLLVTYAVGDLLGIVFLAVYYRWSKQRSYVLKAVAIAFVCNAIVAIYVVLGAQGVLKQSESSFKQVVGYIAIASSLVLYSSPLSTIKLVLQTKSSASIPAPMIITGVINNALWIIYGILLKDIILVLPTSINVVLGVAQVVLYIVYRPKRNAASTNTGGAAIQPLEILTPTSSTTKNAFEAMVSPTGSTTNAGEVELFRITIEPLPQRDALSSPAPYPNTA